MTTSPADTRQVLRDADAGDRAVRGGIVRLFGYGAGMALTAAGSIVLLRYLGVQDFGRYATVMAIVAVVQGLTDAGLNVVGQREYVLRADPQAQTRLLTDVLGIRLVLTPLGVLLAAGFAIVAGYDGDMVLGTLLAGAGVVVANAAVTLTIPLSSALRLGWVTAADVARQAAIVVTWLALVVVGASLGPFFAAQIVGGAAALLVTVVALRGGVHMRPTFSFARWRPLITAALPITASLILNVAYLRTLLVLMSLLATETEVGLFAASVRVVEVFLGVPMLMVGAAFPIFVHAGGEDEARLRYAIDRVTQASLLTGIALALGVAVGAEPIVVILGGEEFRGAADVLRIQAFVLVPAFLTQVAAFGLVAIHRQRSLVVINGIALATVLGLGVVLIGVGGDKGAAVAAVAGETALALAAWVLLLRARPALRPPSGPLARVLVAAVPGVLVALIPGLPPLIAAALAVLVFCGAAWALGAVPAELTQALLRRRGA